MTENESNADAQPSNKAKSARSAPPIIDLEAQELKSEQPSSDEGKADSIAASKPLNLHWIGAALVGGLIGGALVAGVLHFVPAKESGADRLTALETSIGQLGSQASIKLLETRLAKAESTVSDLRKSLEQNSKSSPELTARLNTIEEALGHINVQASSADGTFSKSALRLTLAMLIKDKVSNDIPYDDAYNALVTLAGSPSSNEILVKFSKSGLASYEVLKSEFVKINTASKPVEDTTPPSPISFSDRMLNMLSHVVTITSADQMGMGTKASLIAIETAIANHQGAKAFELWQSLPENDKQRLAPWASHLREKLDAEMATDVLITDALHALDMKGISQ